MSFGEPGRPANSTPRRRASWTLRSCFRLPGRSPTQAREAFLAPLRLALNCVTRAQMYLSPASPGEPESLRLSQDPLLLSSSVVEGGLRLRLRHQFRVVEEDGGRAQPCLLYTSPSPRDRTRSRMPS